MSGQTNFEQVNPTVANQDNDATYQGDARTTGGFTTGQIVPSAWLNKFCYQMSTFVQALAWFLSQNGGTIDDGSTSQTQVVSVSTAVSNLATALGSLLILAGGPAAFTVSPTAPTPITGDNSHKLATTAFLQAGLNISLGSSGYIQLPLYLGGFMFQWQYLSNTTGGTFNFPTPFPNAALAVLGADGTSASSGSCGCSVVSASQFSIKVSTQTDYVVFSVGH